MKKLLAMAAAAACLVLAGCSGSHRTFHIVAGSEEEPFAPIVQEFCASQNVTCKIDYKGSLDIGLMLTGNDAPDVDAVWPASSLWLAIYDTHRRIKDLKSIASSPVILGVRMSKARELGWIRLQGGGSRRTAGASKRRTPDPQVSSVRSAAMTCAS